MEIIQVITDNLDMIAALVAGGLFMGFISGLLGIGGGAFLVPILMEAFDRVGVPNDISLQLAIGTSLLVMVPTTLRSFYAHKKRGSVDPTVLTVLRPSVIIGVAIGAATAKYADTLVLKIVWSIGLTFLAAKMIFARDHWRLGDDVPLGFGMRLYGVAVGWLSSLMSLGGGAFTSSMMTLYGRPMVQAVGTSSGIGPLIAVPGVIGFIWAGWGVDGLPFASIGYVSLIGAAIIIPASVLMAPVGARVAHGISKRKLELAFALSLIFLSVKFFMSL